MFPDRTVVLSLDAELIWGFHDHAEIPTERVEHARESWVYLLELFDEYGLPATWAVVGHLFLDSCDGVHSDSPVGEDWYSRDPGGELAPDSVWFGRDLIDAIRDSKADHDIGSHSFSHVEFGSKRVSEEVARAELERSVEVAEEYGIDLESFVFPRNKVGHRGLLAEYGFSCYRGRSPDRWYDTAPIRPLGKLATYALGASSPPIVDPRVDDYGLVNVPASMYLFTFEGFVRKALETVAGDPVARQVELGLERLKEEDRGVFHLWLHPNNVTTEQDRRRLERIVSMIAEYRDRYDIDVMPMSRVANRVRTNE
ncbi:Polysaccharide deacetylase [Halorubrum aquaticum]|uniref:Polysaccharide deacetylase n=1 Tax=Halorubrum aquaticum TaxID=387340 RepID=A0A1I2ZN59_9EURY|nr:polysaccharide deacetylase family protein [Halorubrum aquaticum]SFH38949.1 Polysaccharide deacetylase [Halorubrum aquaticum]